MKLENVWIERFNNDENCMCTKGSLKAKMFSKVLDIYQKCFEINNLKIFFFLKINDVNFSTDKSMTYIYTF